MAHRVYAHTPTGLALHGASMSMSLTSLDVIVIPSIGALSSLNAFAMTLARAPLCLEIALV